MTFTKNQNYFEKGKPAIEEVTVQIVPDDAVRKTMMLQGDADIDMWINVNTVDQPEKFGKRQGQSQSHRPLGHAAVHKSGRKRQRGRQASPHPILSDVRVRQAIRMAIDVDTINEQIFFGLGNPTWTEFFRPPYNTCNIPRPRYSPRLPPPC